MRNLLLFVVSFALVFCSVLASFAGMSPADVTATTSGINEALSLFYTIGGTILVVSAAIWGFKRVKALLGGGIGWTEESEKQYDYKKIQADDDKSFMNRQY